MPPLFTWLDALTYGLMAVIVTALIAVAFFNGRNKDKPWWRWCGAWGVALLFWAGYASVLMWRCDLRQRVVCVTDADVVFVADGGSVPGCTEANVEVERVLALWRAVPDIDVPEKLHVMVFVKPFPFALHSQPGNKFAGFSKPHESAIGVGMDGRPLEMTALSHELGHVLLYRNGLPADEGTLRDYRDRYGIPY